MLTADLARFIALVERNAHVEAVEAFMQNASMQENQAVLAWARRSRRQRAPRAGQGPLADVDVHPAGIRLRDRVVIRWVFRFEWLDGT